MKNLKHLLIQQLLSPKKRAAPDSQPSPAPKPKVGPSSRRRPAEDEGDQEKKRAATAPSDEYPEPTNEVEAAKVFGFNILDMPSKATFTFIYRAMARAIHIDKGGIKEVVESVTDCLPLLKILDPLPSKILQSSISKGVGQSHQDFCR